jgi:hypothetical protein
MHHEDVETLTLSVSTRIYRKAGTDAIRYQNRCEKVARMVFVVMLSSVRDVLL